MLQRRIKIIKVGLIGNGKWGKNYKNTLLKSSSFKVTDLTIITKSNYDRNNLKNLFKTLNKKFDGFIIAVPPNKQNKILIEILKLNIPVIIEKPLCMNKYEFSKILKHKHKNQIIYVNHYHLFSSSFRKFQESFESSHVRKVFIQDGNFGPFRKNVSPILDWAPHSFGIIFNMFKSKLISFHYSKKLIKRDNDIEIMVLKFLFIFSSGQKAFVKIGNGFKERKNKISISLNNNKNIIFENNIFNPNQKLINKNVPKPMENLLQEFYNSIISKTCNNTSFDIAKKTSNFIFNNSIKY